MASFILQHEILITLPTSNLIQIYASACIRNVLANKDFLTDFLILKIHEVFKLCLKKRCFQREIWVFHRNEDLHRRLLGCDAL
jgi:hypothetical protein